MSQQTINVGSFAFDPSADGGQTGGTKINANFNELYGQAATTVNNVVYVDPFGAKGDGTTDDTSAIQAAENTRTAGQVLKFTPGKTYALGQTVAANLLKVKVAGVWDFREATLLYSGASNLVTGSDGGALGVVNVLASNVTLWGTIDGNSKANYPLSFKSQISGAQLVLTIARTRETSGIWPGVNYACSSDVTGVGISGRAQNVSGFLSRPSCPFTDTTDAINGHGDVTAVLIGGNQTVDNATSLAIVAGGSQYDIYYATMGRIGIMTTPKLQEGNVHWFDVVLHDLGCNIIETYGHGIFGTNFGLDGTTPYPGHILKGGAVSAWSWDNSNTATTNPPNARIQGMSRAANAAAQQGYGYLAGQFLIGNDKPSGTASYTPDLSKGNDFVVPASGAALTINAPTNVPVNPSGLLLTQVFSVTIQRLAGGALTTTWNAAYHLAGSWTDPSGANTQRSIWFRYDIGAGVAYEISRSAADVTV